MSSTMVESMADDMLACCWSLLAHRDSKPFQPWSGYHPKRAYAWKFKPPQPLLSVKSPWA